MHRFLASMLLLGFASLPAYSYYPCGCPCVPAYNAVDFSAIDFSTGNPMCLSPFGLTGLSLATFDPAKFTHAEWVDGKVHETGFTCLFTPNTLVGYTSGSDIYDVNFVSATESNMGDTYAAVTSRSYHWSCVNSLLMDGSVQTINNSISLSNWRALGTRAGGEVITGSF